MRMLTATQTAPVPDVRPIPRTRTAGRLLVRWSAAAGWSASLAYGAALLASHLWLSGLRDDRPFVIGGAWVAFAIRTLSVHFALGFLLLVLLATAVRRWKLATVALAAALASVAPNLRDLPMGTAAPAGGAHARTARLLEANLWQHNYRTGPLIEEIKAADPDLIVFNEYAPQWDRAATARLAERYPHVLRAVQVGPYGMAIYSRLPVLEHDDFTLRLGGVPAPQSRTVVEIDERPVVIYAVHLRTPTHPAMFREQRAQVADLLARLDGEVNPVIVLGDFNFTNNCAQADALYAYGLRDGISLGGAGPATTWPNVSRLRSLPGFRIDHAYLSRELTATHADVGRGFGSDHRPVWIDVAFAADRGD